jgi:hypothetical protein
LKKDLLAHDREIIACFKKAEEASQELFSVLNEIK